MQANVKHAALVIGKMTRIAKDGDLLHFLREDYVVQDNDKIISLVAEDGDRIDIPAIIVHQFLHLVPDPAPHVDRWFGLIARRTQFSEWAYPPRIMIQHNRFTHMLVHAEEQALLEAEDKAAKA